MSVFACFELAYLLLYTLVVLLSLCLHLLLQLLDLRAVHHSSSLLVIVVLLKGIQPRRHLILIGVP